MQQTRQAVHDIKQSILLRCLWFTSLSTILVATQVALQAHPFCLRIFHPVNSLVVNRNLWLILLSNIGQFLIQSNTQQKFSKILRITNLWLFFLQLQWLLSYQLFCDFSLNKSCKTYLGPMLPPGGRKWKLINPHWIG